MIHLVGFSKFFPTHPTYVPEQALESVSTEIHHQEAAATPQGGSGEQVHCMESGATGLVIWGTCITFVTKGSTAPIRGTTGSFSTKAYVDSVYSQSKDFLNFPFLNLCERQRKFCEFCVLSTPSLRPAVPPPRRRLSGTSWVQATVSHGAWHVKGAGAGRC